MKNKYYIISLLITLMIIISFFIKKNEPPSFLTKMIRVELVDEEKKLFEVVFMKESKFNYFKNNTYQLCVGDSSKRTYKSTCEIIGDSVQVLHFIKKDYQNTQSKTICIYIDNESCKIGDPNGEMFKLE